jgi:GT2 family glycosyltransferase
LLTAMQRWNPDYIFGFMARTVAFKGFAERMGYMHNEPGAVALVPQRVRYADGGVPKLFE